MGYGGWDSGTYDYIRSSYFGKSADTIFKNTVNKVIDSEMDPLNIKVRESRDSSEHPESLAIIIGLDETGSMGHIPEEIIKSKLGTLMNTLIDNKVKDAHLMFMGLGDHYSDQFPLQVGQFEAEPELLDKWLKSINLEGNGGGQNMESYLLAWLIAGRHTSIDCFEKRNKKGFLFTIGDEKTHPQVEVDWLKENLGYKQADTISAKQLLSEAQRLYHVFHIHVNETGYKDNMEVINSWKDLLGERLLILNDHSKICELISTTVAVINGANIDTVVSGFDASTALAIKNTISSIVNNSNSIDLNTNSVINL